MSSAPPIKPKLVEMSLRYLSELKTYLNASNQESLKTAHQLGCHAVCLGLDILDLARMHEIAIASLVLPHYSPGSFDVRMSRAALFFAEAITPIEATHRGAVETNTQLKHAVAALAQRTQQLALSVDDLNTELIRRTAVEESLRDSQLTTKSLLNDSVKQHKEMRRLSHQLLNIQEDERRRISRELHDVISQALASINLQLAKLNSQSKDANAILQKNIASTQLLVTKTVDIIHRFARDLRPTVLDDLGLIPALKSFIKSFLEDTGIRVNLTAFAEIEKVPHDTRTTLFRVAQEALNNVALHAKTGDAEVTITNHSALIKMDITDNGQGFIIDSSSSTPAKSNRLGLLGMRERCEMIGGTFHVLSKPGHGTTIRIEVPRVKTPPSSAPHPLVSPTSRHNA